MNYDQYTLHELKHLGHDLLDTYTSLEHRPWRKGTSKAVDHAYKKLATKLEKDEWKAHFGQMRTRLEVIQAISRLKRMIKQRKRRIKKIEEERKYKVFLPREELIKALDALKK